MFPYKRYGKIKKNLQKNEKKILNLKFKNRCVIKHKHISEKYVYSKLYRNIREIKQKTL